MNTPSDIYPYLASLAGFHKLIEGRARARERNQHLDSFIVLGRYWLGDDGTLMRCTFHSRLGDVAWLPDVLPSVVAGTGLAGRLRNVDITLEGVRLPREEDVCDDCGESWTIETCHEAMSVRAYADGKWVTRHRLCHRLSTAKVAQIRYANVMCRAGLGGLVLEATKNEYYINDDTQPPWVRIRTSKGDIKFGLRKRVFNVDWSDVVAYALRGRLRDASYDDREAFEASLSAATLFPTEEVTKGSAYIHAWSEDKLVEYLRTVAEAVQIGKFWKGAPTHE